MGARSRTSGPATTATGRCEATRNPGVWPYTSRCSLAPHGADKEHLDVHGRWRDEPVTDVELPSTFVEANALLLVQGGHEAQARRTIRELTSRELRDLRRAGEVLVTLCDAELMTRIRAKTGT